MGPVRAIVRKCASLSPRCLGVACRRVLWPPRDRSRTPRLGRDRRGITRDRDPQPLYREEALGFAPVHGSLPALARDSRGLDAFLSALDDLRRDAGVSTLEIRSELPLPGLSDQPHAYLHTIDLTIGKDALFQSFGRSRCERASAARCGMGCCCGGGSRSRTSRTPITGSTSTRDVDMASPRSRGDSSSSSGNGYLSRGSASCRLPTGAGSR